MILYCALCKGTETYVPASYIWRGASLCIQCMKNAKLAEKAAHDPWRPEAVAGKRQ